MVEQRCEHGPDKIITQEHMHFITFNSPANFEYSNNFSLTSFCSRLHVFVSFVVKFKFIDHVNVMMHTQLEDTGEMGSICNSSFLTLALAF